MTQQNADLARALSPFWSNRVWGSKVSLQSMRSNGQPICATLLSDELAISGFTKPGGERLCNTHTRVGERWHKPQQQGADRRAAGLRPPQSSNCQPPGHTEDVPERIVMIDLSSLILCTDSITSWSAAYLRHTNTHTSPPNNSNPMLHIPQSIPGQGSYSRTGHTHVHQQHSKARRTAGHSRHITNWPFWWYVCKFCYLVW